MTRYLHVFVFWLFNNIVLYIEALSFLVIISYLIFFTDDD